MVTQKTLHTCKVFFFSYIIYRVALCLYTLFKKYKTVLSIKLIHRFIAIFLFVSPFLLSKYEICYINRSDDNNMLLVCPSAVRISMLPSLSFLPRQKNLFSS